MNSFNGNKWPPIKGNIVTVQKPNDNRQYIGKVSKTINDKMILVLLMDNNEYVDKELEDIKYSQLMNNKGLLVLRPHYNWKYTDIEFNEEEIIDHINNVAKGYNNFKKMYLNK